MKLIGTSKKTAYILIAALICVLGFAVYYYVLYPKMEERDALQNQIGDLKTQSKQLQKKLTAIKTKQEAEKKSVSELKTEVPTNRELSSLIDAIEQLESVSNTEVTNITFNNYDAAVKETIKADDQKSGQTTANSTEPSTSATQTANSTQSNHSTGTATENTNPAGQTGGANTGEKDAQQASGKNTTPVSPIFLSSLPDSLKLVTMNLSVSATDKKEIRDFLKEIETLPRIMRIDSVSYATPDTEVTGSQTSSTATSNNQLQATIQLTTFYYVGQLDDQQSK